MIFIAENVNYSSSTAIKEIFSVVKEKLDSGLSKKVDLIDGYGLSQENYTANDMQKLTNIEPNAQVNKIDIIKVNSAVLPVSDTDKSVDIDIPTQINQLIVDPSDPTVKVLTSADGIATESYVSDIEKNLSVELDKKANTDLILGNNLIISVNNKQVGTYSPMQLDTAPKAQTINIDVSEEYFKPLTEEEIEILFKII